MDEKEKLTRIITLIEKQRKVQDQLARLYMVRPFLYFPNNMAAKLLLWNSIVLHHKLAQLGWPGRWEMIRKLLPLLRTTGPSFDPPSSGSPFLLQ